MTEKSNNNGRAYEYACLISLEKEISESRDVRIEENSSLDASKKAWDTLSQEEQTSYLKSATAGIKAIFEYEPMILQKDNDVLTLLLQSDQSGISGDVRDVLIIRKEKEWEIGLSVKRNHFAVKHSRLAKNLDFGEKWIGIKCSKDYWKDIEPIFNYIRVCIDNNRDWKELEDKEAQIYIPILEAFMTELKRLNSNNENVPRKMVEYLLGFYDFYKVIGEKKETIIQAYNLRGTLNKNNRLDKIIPIAALPSEIVALKFKTNSKNTIELYMNEGWQFSFRIHNASVKVEASLKFDIQVVGMPTTIFTLHRKWI